MRYAAFVLALAAEFAALYFLPLAHRDLPALALFGASHLGASLLMAYTQSAFLPERYRTRTKTILPLLSMLNFIVPILGIAMGWILTLWGFRRAARLLHGSEVDAIDPQIVTEEFPVTRRIFGEGSLATLLQNRYVPTASKIKALSILSQIKNASSVKMIRQTLSDSDDEVRLVGFSMIDKREKAMNEKISALLQMLKTSTDPRDQATHHKELAFAYWELLYQGIVDTHLAHYIEKSVQHHLEEAQKIDTQNAALYKLQGRLHMRRREYPAAKAAFVKALDLGIREAQIASYMAEISFLERNFSRVPYWMEKIPEHTLDYQLLALAAVWRERRNNAHLA